jgi:hypothetical protein
VSWLGFLNDASRTPEPAPVVVAHEPAEHSAWCSHCDQDREYDILPGHPASKVYGAIPSWAFCCFCGWLLDVDVEGVA